MAVAIAISLARTTSCGRTVGLVVAFKRRTTYKATVARSRYLDVPYIMEEQAEPSRPQTKPKSR